MDGEARGERKLQGEKRKENYAAKRAEFLQRPTYQGLLETRLLFLEIIVVTCVSLCGLMFSHLSECWRQPIGQTVCVAFQNAPMGAWEKNRIHSLLSENN